MRSSTDTLTTTDGTPLFVRRWLPDGPGRAVVQLAHGMAEHSARYERFAERLTREGYAVYAADHRGHGQTASSATPDHGYLADRAGFDTVVADLHAVTEMARRQHPDLPVVLFGHSMGSFLARAYVLTWGHELAGLVLSGTAGDPGALGRVGRVVALAQARARGRRHPSGLMNTLTFGQYNAPFKPNRTAFDWLSRDPEEVDKYVADLECGNVFTAGFYADLLEGLARVNADGEVSRVSKDLPILLVSGDMDPVGGMGKGVARVAAQYERLGVRDVTMKVYPEARHELLNETNRDEVMDDIVAWLAERLPAH
ncbi:alpha/beta hydrolase [Intrasporangium calvum]|uniref:Alpha/beta hydrolase fold protein n=1 Tax=Intrasporangium calvum (strain ATCC 23552 / DSM 43043 / JCM 3097 / NBRC 12989 / NCIMB 10167 / NRRL B-3866 / 7 KIP) TaxID=710696 RepID=E6SEN3_INTC7|nr:alpha/beta hydrolase [Intrasporangium calvum]ADU46634.1 alpha/beta hydrolase fold protein [Intrasporangium calvum DSM 43043]